MADAIWHANCAGTTLGPIQDWPSCLRFADDLVLGYAFLTTLQWGAKLILFRNDAYIPFIGERQPAALGRPILETFPEIVTIFGRWPRFRRTIDASGPAGEAHQIAHG